MNNFTHIALELKINFNNSGKYEFIWQEYFQQMVKRIL